MQAGSNVWLLTGRDKLMPGVLLGTSYREGIEFYDVESPTGKIYSANPANVYGYHEGKAMLKQRRSEQLVAEGYEVKLMSSGAYHVCCPKKHGAGGGYIVRALADGALTCTCPDYAKSVGECRRLGTGEAGCKHSLGLSGLLHAKASQAAEAGKANHVQTYVDLAANPAGIHELTPRKMTLQQRFAARGLDVNRDF